MGREVKRIHKRFKWPLEKPWWGYVLPGVPCPCCHATGQDGDTWCCVCGGEGHVFPKFEPPGVYAAKYPDDSPIFGDIGWQMWETTSEGSPISPVCDSPEELAQWLADNESSACGDMTATVLDWLAMIKAGSAPTMVMGGGKGIRSGVEAAGEKEDTDA